MDRGGELVTRDAALVQHRPHLEKAALGWVEKHRDGVAELTSGDVESGQPAEAFPLLDALGAGQKSGEQPVQQVEHVVAGVGLQLPGHGEQGGGAPRLGHPGQGLVLGLPAHNARLATRPGGTADRSSSPTPS